MQMLNSFILALKIIFVSFLFILVRAAFPRYRYDQLMSIGWFIFLPITLGFSFFTSAILYSFNILLSTNNILSTAVAGTYFC